MADPISLYDMARALGGEVAGSQVLCPAPGHTARDRSLAVKPSRNEALGFVITAFAGDDWQACRDHVRARLGLPQWRTPAADDPVGRMQAREAARSAAEADRRSAQLRIERALALWREAKDPRGTLVERYLASRHLSLPAEAAGHAIRFHDRCPWKDADRDITLRVPAMVCAMRSVETGAIVAVHRTRLTPDGQKVDRRMLGPAAGTAIMLDGALGDELAIGEGVETCLAARQLAVGPAWAMGSAGAIGGFPVMPAVRTLRLLAEVNDRANQRAIDQCALRWHAAGRKVVIITPNVGKDMNDALRGAV